jgi:hypothetical protein
MNTRRGIPVRVIVGDSGPLISLAACDRLSLLCEFRNPVSVPDVIRAECLRYPEKIGAVTLEEWFRPETCPAEIIATPILAAWEKAVAAETADPGLRLSDGLGDAAIAWVLRQAQLGIGLDGPTLVLTEDGPFGDSVLRSSFPEVHVLSTRAFLRTLENFHRIPSAQAVIGEIASAGRQLARYLADRPGYPAPGTRTTWAEVLSAEPDPGPGDRL